MTTPHLFGALQSGHSFKVRLFLRLAEIAHDYTSIDIGAPRDQRPEPFRSIAPHGEVPVLLDDGETLAQSNAILLHLARKHGRFGGDTVAQWNEITSWLFWEANRIGRSFPNLRWHRLFDPNGAPDLVGWFHATAEVDLDRLERQLTDRAFILDRPTIVDLSCAG
jgi:glutathione S-transferase